ncbi:alpha/beta fold hydrolase [Hyphococcus sp. DH-69]|uniref:alpha/beta fold hydrolase n=1 Tax=Hyphococcus formosus TaxID=3143534 RepID=UPI00398B996C
MKKIAYIALPLIVLFGVLVLLRTPDTDPVAMAEKYTNAESQFADNGAGLRVHYRDQGNPDGIPIVLIHGTSASLHNWEPLVALLGDEYRIITYSQPGHGLTGPHPEDNYQFSGMADAIDLLVETLDLDQFVLGGNSMGGWVSWRYAVANPDKVSALILLDASGMPLRDGEENPPLNIGFRLLGTPIGRFLMQQYTPRALVERSALESVSVKSIITDEMVDRYWELLRLPGNRKAAALRARADREIHFAEEIRKLTIPTLIIWGAEDQLIYASAVKSFSERLPHAEAVIYPGIGHLPMEEAPEQTAQDIDKFLETHFPAGE